MIKANILSPLLRVIMTNRGLYPINHLSNLYQYLHKNKLTFYS